MKSSLVIPLIDEEQKANASDKSDAKVHFSVNRNPNYVSIPIQEIPGKSEDPITQRRQHEEKISGGIARALPDLKYEVRLRCGLYLLSASCIASVSQAPILLIYFFLMNRSTPFLAIMEVVDFLVFAGYLRLKYNNLSSDFPNVINQEASREIIHVAQLISAPSQQSESPIRFSLLKSLENEKENIQNGITYRPIARDITQKFFVGYPKQIAMLVSDYADFSEKETKDGAPSFPNPLG